MGRVDCHHLHQRSISHYFASRLLDKRSSTIRAERTLASGVPDDPPLLLWSWVGR
jgi:hypothetical protein